MKIYIKIGLLVIWMGIIFLFSCKTGAESIQSSQFVLSLIKLFGIDVNSMFGHLSQLLLRKSAHMLEYFILCLLIYNLIKDYLNLKMILSILISFLYACTDEIHQFFVVDRGPSFYDVLVDTLGAILAMILIYLIKMIKRMKSRN